MDLKEFILFVERRQEALRRFLTALCCGDTATADDIAQEALLKAWLAVDDLHDAGRADAWLRRIAYNTFLNHRRSQRPTASYDEADAMTSSDRADDAFRYQSLHRALRALSAAERTSIALYYMEDFSVREIAEIENTSESAVRQHLSRGRRHLKELIS
ncbi:MAG: RNA polymerase sigma factor [Bacteroides sp.]|nr:RNA polymerase sigma factor [Bacteroides sp.]MBD5371551.1 RNA polymerase sigma factor [Bacteroides sp.]